MAGQREKRRGDLFYWSYVICHISVIIFSEGGRYSAAMETLDSSAFSKMTNTKELKMINEI